MNIFSAHHSTSHTETGTDNYLPDHGYDPTAGHHAPFERTETDEAKAERTFWRTELLFDHVI